ncbi:glycosyl hydrolase [Gilvimarinus sp. DA14]|uniref:glycosyl hydrolase n=1 Tax=Gilvimarinus sp. DA14 TaxID=2956798 RepID=UPI0020B86396|nr:glycosyl hydrolase [Gilvimarinus sp. DA14]UTF58670.1 mannan endo-1,4-beta-mannosidase [Gilvimarinus sp. DA14]
MRANLIRALALACTTIVLSACGSSGGGSTPDNPVTGSSSTHPVISSSSSMANTTSSSSSLSSAASSPGGHSAIIPNAASNGSPYCRYSEADDGWGWENSHNCVVYQSAADPGAGEFGHCKVGSEEISYCESNEGDWQIDGSGVCIAYDFCPGNKAKTQAPMSTQLVTANASETAQQVFDYLQSVWGEKMLSGQMDLTWADDVDMHQRVLNDTGKSPAIMGYDFMNYGAYANGSGLTQTEEAIEYWNQGGLVTFAWHWRDPSGETKNFYASEDDASKNAAFTIPVANGELDTASEAFTALERDVDLIAGELQKLENAGVPVLWRPLHEAAGGWFWWGRARTDGVPAAYAQKLLWRYMFQRLTHYHGLNNLIWVWNGQNAIWYPGDDVVDIVSTDIYDGAQNYESQKTLYDVTKAYPHREKMVALSENSNIPDPDAMATDNVWWLWFMVWNDGALDTMDDHANNFWTGEYYNTDAHKKHVYEHELVITRDELPEF